MARPKKNNADYFSHDKDMRNDPKVRAIRKNFGNTAYAVWCFILEILTDSDFFEIDWNEITIELLSGDFDCDSDWLKQLIEYMAKLELLSIENGKLFSQTHKKRFESLLSKRKRDTLRFFAGENTQRKEKESKAKESKEDPDLKEVVKPVKKRAVFTPPTLDEVAAYCTERKNEVDPQKWIDHYAAKGWMIGKNKMKDWQAAVRTWENNNENEKVKPAYIAKSKLPNNEAATREIINRAYNG